MNSSTRIALVTGASMAKPDPESHLLVAALARRGIAAELVPWDSAQAWASYRLVVVRTPWDYFARLQEFLDWARRTSALTDFVNPFSVIEWNSHKRYLFELGLHHDQQHQELFLMDMLNLMSRSPLDPAAYEIEPRAETLQITRVIEHVETHLGFFVGVTGGQAQTPPGIRFVDPEEHCAQPIANRMPT